ncbi:ATP-binding protein [Rhizobium sp. 1AS11]|uniref:ATP-binding protein n=1 Tax=Rhizobium acaciae TaxID=2989736 RepID=UPI0022232A3D|nr:ATP-binding protein [Rhizobium acaciae]MCW1411239.1 ATP-binding protein [Rhizobium acaciae]MCW1743349.1 ATP-binding protein [Rhizobium acaciae]
MRGQLILALFGVLLVVQCASTWLFLEERRSAIRAFTAKEGASRVINVARELEQAPAATRTTILRAAESRELRLDVDQVALARRSDAEPLAQLTREITRLLEPPPGRDLAIVLAKPEAGGFPRSAPYEGDWDEDPLMLVVSVALNDRRFLNARIDIGEPPLQWAWPAFISILLTACGVVAAVWFLSGHIAGPMATLAVASIRLGRGEPLEPLLPSGPTEVRQVTEAFNEMAERLTRLLNERARMLAAIGHDLRSPITAMQLRVELLEDTESRERLEACLDEIQSLVQAALALARGASTDEPRVTVNLHDLLKELVGELVEAGGKATLAAPAEVSIMARSASLKRALRNIAENAVRYGGKADIRILRCQNHVRIEIEDDGPGIREADRERVFEPFVRLEISRSRNTGGSGLGLSIARTVIESHGGSVTLEQAPAGGSRAVILWPAL